VNYLISSGCEENVRDSEGKLPKDLQPSIGLKFKPGPGFLILFLTFLDLNSLPKHLRTENQPKETSEEEEMKKLAKERMEKLKKQINENENDEL
jgi:hypothetical protein